MKQRVDLMLVERGLSTTRSQAQALLLSGRVYVGERRVDKAGTRLDVESELLVRETQRFVSRGGDKLSGALDALGLRPVGATCLDIGASTGGFTDCLLKYGARRVYAVDVGHGQLAPSLVKDCRVVNREGENARHLEAASFAEAIDWIVVDASFIGLSQLLPACGRILPSGGTLVALIKPQFEVGRAEAHRARGVIRDESLRLATIASVTQAVALAGFEVLGSVDSALRGPKGNLEHFLYARRS